MLLKAKVVVREVESPDTINSGLPGTAYFYLFNLAASESRPLNAGNELPLIHLFNRYLFK